MDAGPDREPADLIIDDCEVLTSSGWDEATISTRRAIVIRDGRIEQVTAADAARELPANRRLDARGRLAMPGLVNGHTHAAMSLFRGAAEGDFAIWFNEQIWPMEANLAAGDVRLGTTLAIAEMIRAGVTCFDDMYFAMDEAVDAVAATGMRARLAQGFFSDGGPEMKEAAIDFALRHNGAAGGLITTAVAPHATYTCTEDDLRFAADAARAGGIGLHVHAAEEPEQVQASLSRLGVTPIEVLERTGVLDAGTTIAHAKAIVDGDLEVLQRHADRVAVAACPKGYLKMGTTTTPLKSLTDVGVTVALGTDGCGSNNTLDVFESMRFALLVHLSHGDWEWATATRMLHHGIVHGAAAVGVDGGSLERGRVADLILVDLDQPHLQPVHDVPTALCLSLQPSDVRCTIVGGRILMEERELTTIDLPPLLAEVRRRAPELRDTSHGRRIQTYQP